MRRSALLVAAVAAAAAGCGSGAGLPPRLREGRTLFLRDCASCHTLAGRESGAIGGDLVEAHLGAADVASFARVMPTRPHLSRAAADVVADYVVFVARAHGRR